MDRPGRTFPRFIPAGDCGLLVELGDRIDPDISQRVRALTLLLSDRPPAGVREVAPGYLSALVVYDPLRCDLHGLIDQITVLEALSSQAGLSRPRTVEIPVCYGGVYGPDIEDVAALNGLTVQQVVELHSSATYMVYMLGFTPGYPYLGGLPEQLHTPRLATPRTSVPAGSVAIGGNQTGIYPIASPGGWRLIGRTPLTLFNALRQPPTPYDPGDLLRFKAIDAERYEQMAATEAAR